MKALKRPYGKLGGVHLPYSKELTAFRQIESIPLPPNLHVSMSQHFGIPATPVVQKGDSVLKGQLIGKPAGFVSAAVHAPTSGKIINVTEKPTVRGTLAPSVEIEPDGEDKWDATIVGTPGWQQLDKKTIIEKIASAGVVGMGGAGFPAHIKLSPPPEKKIDILIINGAECEPYLTADQRLMMEYPQLIYEGILIIQKILGVETIYVVIEDNKPEAIQVMKQALKKGAGQILAVEKQYPQGAEKQLIYSVTGREVPSGGLPMDIGALVQNVGTCAAISEAIVKARPLIRRIITVTGESVRTPKNLSVLIGTPFSFLIESCDGFSRKPGKIICGGPMMGLAQSSLDIAVTKTTSGIVVLPQEQVYQFASMPCIGCGRCIEACPMGLLPCELGDMIEAEDFEGAEAAHVLDCIECGSCAYECVSHRPLVQYMQRAKAEIDVRAKKKAQ